jgi:hypothetical protein
MKMYGRVELHLLLPSTWTEVSGQLHTPVALSPGKVERKWGWMGPRADLDAVDKSLLLLPGIEPRFLGHPNRNPSLYRLRYPGFILSRNRVTIDGLLVGNRIYWTLLTHNSWLLFTHHCHTQTSVLSHGLHCSAWQHLPTVDVPSTPTSYSSNSAVSRLSRSLSLSHIATDGQSVCLSWRRAPSGAHGSWSSLYSLFTELTENTSSIIACSLVAGERCPHSCSLATSVVMLPVYTAVAWH